MINKIKSFFSNLFKSKRNQNYVSVKEVKQLYRNFSKNELIRVIIKLGNENALLKLRPMQNKTIRPISDFKIS